MKRFRIKASRSFHSLDGIEFEVDDDATDAEIASAAAEAVNEWLDYGWEEIADD